MTRAILHDVTQRDYLTKYEAKKWAALKTKAASVKGRR